MVELIEKEKRASARFFCWHFPDGGQKKAQTS